jgi:AcrR family transcriptional regulator
VVAQDRASGVRAPRPALGDLQGVLPARQHRSQARQAAMISTGLQILEQRGFDALSIAELTAANGFSVGSFYARFEDKDAFFRAIQTTALQQLAARAEELLAPERWKGASAGEVLTAFVEFFVGTVRRHRGFLRAVLQHESTQPGVWTPMRECGAALAALLQPILGPKLPRLPRHQREAQVGFAVQVLYGTLINAVLHDPGPLALEDKALIRELVRMMSRYLGLKTKG